MDSHGWSSSCHGLRFEVDSTVTVVSPTKYVNYVIKVYQSGETIDEHPCFIQRRYSEFLDLFTKLRHEFPDLTSSFTFPKKAIIGNFSEGVLITRMACFEMLLLQISQHKEMLESPAFLEFFQNKEQSGILHLITICNYEMAAACLEISLRLLNKLLTDRHPAVLRCLCLLVACCDASKNERTCRYANAAVVRFESVSDIDSLRYYVPLLQLCVRILPDSQVLQDRLSSMKQRGFKVDGCPSLLNAVLADFPTYSASQIKSQP